MPKRCGQGQGTLAVDDGAVHLARHPDIVAHLGIDPPEPQGITQRLGEGLGAAQVVEEPLMSFAQGIERSAYAEMEVDSLLGPARLSGTCSKAMSACSTYPTASR